MADIVTDQERYTIERARGELDVAKQGLARFKLEHQYKWKLVVSAHPQIEYATSLLMQDMEGIFDILDKYLPKDKKEGK